MTPGSLSYPEALAALAARGRFGIHLGLGRTAALLASLGHPERAFRGVLVAGTNGKGSVLALMGSALTAAGYRVGETPKPHLVTYRERLQIGGRPVDPDTFASLASRVLARADRVARRHGDPTEFELLTAITFLWFAEAGIDLAVVEVGLGGRLDATHAWDGGVAVVTNVTLDHTDRLGTTVEAIAREKAAIIMRGDLAVTGAWGSALDVIERRSRRVAAPLVVTPPAPLRGTDRDGIEVQLGRLGRARVGLRGRHQAANVAVADAALDALESAGIARVSAEARRVGYATVSWPGRLELIEIGGSGALPGSGSASGPASGPASGSASGPASGGGSLAPGASPGSGPASGGASGPASGTASGGGSLAAGASPGSGPARGGSAAAAASPADAGPGLAASREVLLDGAHNPAGAATLAEAFDDLAPFLRPGRPTLVLAIMADKDVDGVIRALGGSTLLRAARVICTAPAGGRALPAEDLAARWASLAGRAAEAVPEPAAALHSALSSGSGPVIVAGSLYLVGAARSILVADPDLVPDPPPPHPEVAP